MLLGEAGDWQAVDSPASNALRFCSGHAAPQALSECATANAGAGWSAMCRLLGEIDAPPMFRCPILDSGVERVRQDLDRECGRRCLPAPGMESIWVRPRSTSSRSLARERRARQRRRHQRTHGPELLHRARRSCDLNPGAPPRLPRCQSLSSPSSHRTRAWRRQDRDR